AEQRADDRRRHRPLDLVGTADEMAAGDMAGLMRQNAEQLADIAYPQDQPGMDVDRLATGDEGVEAVILDEMNADTVGGKAGRREDWRQHRADASFQLRVADKGQATRLRV